MADRIVLCGAGAMNVVAVALFLLTALVLAGCTREAPDTALVAAWDFDAVNGDTAIDVTGQGHEARLSRMSDGEGWHQGTLALNGGNDAIVTVALSERLRATDSGITLSAWTYRTAVHNVAVVSHGYPQLFFGFHGAQYKWQFRHAGGRNTACYADPAHVAEPGRWIHVAATYDGWRARLYADGVEVCSKWTWGKMAMPDAPFTLGGYLDADGGIVDELTGRLDDVRIYDRALAPAQIQTLASQHPQAGKRSDAARSGHRTQPD